MAARIGRYRPLLLFGVVVAALVGVILFQVLRAGPPEAVITALTPAPPAATATSAATSTPSVLRVYVSGAVLLPDVYTLPADSIVKDAIAVAGGASAEADLDRINLAQPVADGQQVYVPRRGEAGLPSRSPLPEPGPVLVNINTAGVDELDTLPGIGPAIAQRIIDYRQSRGPFQSVEQLLDVRGIGPAVLEDIRELITLQ